MADKTSPLRVAPLCAALLLVLAIPLAGPPLAATFRFQPQIHDHTSLQASSWVRRPSLLQGEASTLGDVNSIRQDENQPLDVDPPDKINQTVLSAPSSQPLLERLRQAHQRRTEAVCSPTALQSLQAWHVNATQRWAALNPQDWTRFTSQPIFLLGRNIKGGLADSLTGHVSGFALVALAGTSLFIETLSTSSLEYVGAQDPGYQSLRRAVIPFVQQVRKQFPTGPHDPLHRVSTTNISAPTVVRGACRNYLTNCLEDYLAAPAYAHRQSRSGQATVVDFQTNRGVLYTLIDAGRRHAATAQAMVAQVNPVFRENLPDFGPGTAWGCVANFMLRPGPGLVKHIPAHIINALLDPNIYVVAIHVRWGFMIMRLCMAPTLAKGLRDGCIRAVHAHRDDAVMNKTTALHLLKNPKWFSFVAYSAQRLVREQQQAGLIKGKVRYLITADAQPIKLYLAKLLGSEALFLEWPPVHSRDKDHLQVSYFSEDNEALAQAQAEWYLLGMADALIGTAASGFSRLAAGRAYPRQTLYLFPESVFTLPGCNCTVAEQQLVSRFVAQQAFNDTLEQPLPPDMDETYARCLSLGPVGLDVYANQVDMVGAHM